MERNEVRKEITTIKFRNDITVSNVAHKLNCHFVGSDTITNGAYSYCISFKDADFVIITTDDIQKVAIAELGLFGFEIVRRINQVYIMLADYTEEIDYAAYCQVASLNSSYRIYMIVEAISVLEDFMRQGACIKYAQTAISILEKLLSLGEKYVMFDAHSGNTRLWKGELVPYDIFIPGSDYYCDKCFKERDTDVDGYNYVSDGSEICDSCYQVGDYDEQE